MRLAPPKFDGTTGDGAYDFLTECQDRLFNFGVLEDHRVAYTSYQFTAWLESDGVQLWPGGQLMLQRWIGDSLMRSFLRGLYLIAFVIDVTMRLIDCSRVP